MADVSIIEQIASYLAARGEMPAVQMARIQDGSSGQFEPGVGAFGTITLNPFNMDRGTYPHEMAHAANWAMARQRYKDPMASRQFKGAYDKIYGGSNLSQARDALGGAALSEYRGSADELIPWAVGNQASGSVSGRSGGHLDSDLATRIAILLELASRKK